MMPILGSTTDAVLQVFYAAAYFVLYKIFSDSDSLLNRVIIALVDRFARDSSLRRVQVGHHGSRLCARAPAASGAAADGAAAGADTAADGTAARTRAAAAAGAGAAVAGAGAALKDRRPAANCDPYTVTEQIVRTCCLNDFEN